MNIAFEIQKWIEYREKFTDIVALKIKDFYSLFLPQEGRKQGTKPPENV